MIKLIGDWYSTVELESKTYKCGYCGEKVSINEGYVCRFTTNNIAYIYICHNCNKPTFFDNFRVQTPGVLYGDEVEYLSSEVKELYNEARNCFSVNAFTSSILCCRKLLMNCAVEQGAEEGKQFVYYINFLEDNHYTPKNIKACIDKIRTLGNDGTHKIESRTKEEAELAIDFTALVLKMIYEAPGKLRSKFEDK
ncbi:DUF4145 domain-containing protein [Clostridium perfringens]|uniref:DUF4145 domain-containing protein n=1 Tax=Clostridium perfringens TaxID=1502 RepID=UPI0018E4B02F|nr:DUF4145 domain-containing protein [Clostridium perfringens]EIF6157043.1 DUF4145 domain-containing protein [Clostridium perfringens]MBI6009255.1 DUF4145 domain-containing protein [Clostridium perfringens]MCO6001722.1 DUF4145 domain-containing protein [Clostridium perfringens]MCO7394647.1 DUF4145 domain-containing protein [Clostridium perfringens]MCP8914423.1 DUF4145 domain-containing protein [Clostridium perfringens]